MTPAPEFLHSDEARRLEGAAAAALGAARAEERGLHLPGARDRYREHLEAATALASQALSAVSAAISPQALGAVGATTAPQGADERDLRVGARRTLALAHAARALDARHGANQLAQSSQRAPTLADSEDGWRRVEAIVATAEACAAEAVRHAAELGDGSADVAARAASDAARAARQIVEARNRAFTFHASPRFSFGEGWYLAAAAVLTAGVEIQIEPDQPQSAQAERFLRDAGLGSALVPYRPRPRANKALPEMVAQAFRGDPMDAQIRLRAAFLGSGPIAPAIVDWTDRRLATARETRKVLVWLRHATHHPDRNSTYSELAELCRRALGQGLLPVLIGDALRGGALPVGAVDLTLFWKEPIFQGLDMRRAQLQLFEHLKRAHGLVGQVGVTTAGMDGPALMGLPTLYLTHTANVRLGRWVGAVPGYQEVVRDAAYLDRIERTLSCWAPPA